MYSRGSLKKTSISTASIRQLQHSRVSYFNKSSIHLPKFKLCTAYAQLLIFYASITHHEFTWIMNHVKISRISSRLPPNAQNLMFFFMFLLTRCYTVQPTSEHIFVFLLCCSYFNDNHSSSIEANCYCNCIP